MIFAAMLFALAQSAPLPAAKNPGNLAQDIFFASDRASGRKLCDRKRSARYMRQYEKRYGRRIRALMQYHESQFGQDPNFIFTSSCYGSKASSQQQDRDHARALDRFESVLQELERRYGPPKP